MAFPPTTPLAGNSFLIKEAEAEGYITRREVKPEGRGNWRKYNVLTEKGRKLQGLQGS
jgi:hypothetical protein